MNKILVFLFNGMTDYEITFITHLLSADAGKEVITISYEDNTIKSRAGFLYKSHQLVKEVLHEDVEALILCGGWYGELRNELVELIHNLNLSNKLLAAICGAGTVFLAKAGVLDHVNYTTPAMEWTEQHIKIFGECNPFPRDNFIDKRVVRDRNVITAKGEAFIDFAIEVCDWFNLFDSREEKENFGRRYGNVYAGL